MSNPLISAYRKPKLYISLPSQGRFYTEKPKLSVDGELAVYPMTARDELMTKNPDALFNGESTFALLKSCCPDIPDPSDVPVCDLSVLIIAIRQASYGDAVDFDIKCPECNDLNMLTLSVPNMLASVRPIPENNECVLENDFKVKLRPYNVSDRTALNIQQIKQQKMIEGLIEAGIDDEEREKRFGEMFVSIADLTVKLVKNSIIYVETPDGERVEDDEIILEWLQSITKRDYDAIKEIIDALSDSGINKEVKAKCQNCSHEWTTPIELDAANFFEG